MFPLTSFLLTVVVDSNFSCNGDGIGDITNPGIFDLGDGNTNYNDRLNSFQCFRQ